MTISALDNLLAQLQQSRDEFGRKYTWNPDTESGSFGWNGANGGGALARDENGNVVPFSSSNGVKMGATNQNNALSYDYRPQAYQAGYDVIDPRHLYQVAQKNFGGDMQAALKYRYGDDAQVGQDERFAPFDETGGGYFIKPTDASRLGMGGDDPTRFGKWVLPSEQPNVFKGFLTDGALPSLVQKAIMMYAMMSGAGAAAGGTVAAGGTATGGAELPTGMDLAGDGGINNIQNYVSPPGADGGNWWDKAINDGTLPNTPGSGKAIPLTDSWNDYFDAASRNLDAKMPTTGNKMVDQLLTKAATTVLSGANQATGGTGGDTTGADQQAADEARKKALIEQINAMYDPNNFADEEGKLSDAIRGQQGDALKLGYDKAARATTFDAARRGNVGGSVMADNIAGLNRDNQLGSTKIEDAVNAALSGLRSSRLSSQNNAISLVNAGSGPEAVNAAATGIKNAIDTARAEKIPDITQGLFQNVALSNQAINTGNNTAALGAYINARTNPGGGSLFPLGSRAAGYSVPT